MKGPGYEQQLELSALVICLPPRDRTKVSKTSPSRVPEAEEADVSLNFRAYRINGGVSL